MQQSKSNGFACCSLLAYLFCVSLSTKTMALKSQRKLRLSDQPSFEPASATIMSASDFVMALFTPEIVTIKVAVPELTVDENDWKNYTIPLRLQRNVTITSSDVLKTMTILHFYTQRKVQLGSYVTLTLERVILNPLRLLGLESLPRSPGLDLLMPGTPDTQGAMVLGRDMAFISAFCLPIDYKPITMDWLTRLTSVPGTKQLFNFNVRQPGCINSATAPSMQRCWANRDVYLDLATPAADMTQLATLPQPSNYGIWLLNVTSLCDRLIPTACLVQQDITLAYCVVSTMGNMTPPAAPSPAPALPQQQQPPPPQVITKVVHSDSTTVASGGSVVAAADRRVEERKVLLPALLGSLLGAVVLAVLVAGVLLLLQWRRRRSKGSLDRDDASHHAVQANSAGSLAANRSPSPELCTSKEGYEDDGGANATAFDTQTASSESPRNPDKSDKPAPALPFLRNHEADDYEYNVLTGQSVLDPDLNLAVVFKEPEGGATDGAATEATAAVAAMEGPIGATAGVGSIACGGDSSNCDVVTLLGVVRGQGAFGRVVEGLYRGERVAVKQVMEEHCYAAVAAGASEKQMVETVAQEIEVLGRCRHPNIVRLLAACVRPPRMCLVLELMDTSLDRLIYSRQEPLPLGLVLHIGIEVCRGLAYLHPTVIHRDLKPGNVLINDPWGEHPAVKITDFGLSRLRYTLLVTRNPEAGTPAYTAPECFDLGNPAISHHADVYSFGVLLWELLAGCPPWEGLDLLQIAVRVCVHGQRLPVPPPNRPPGAVHRWPPQLCRLLRQCWEREPRRRPAAEEMAKELLILLQQQQQQQQLGDAS